MGTVSNTLAGVILTVAISLQGIAVVSAQSRPTNSNSSARGYFYAPTPCELLPAQELAATICATVTVPLAVQFSLRPLGSMTSTRAGSSSSGVIRGRSNLRGNFSVNAPRGRYRVIVGRASYRTGAGDTTDVSVPLIPRRAVVSFPARLGQPVAIPLVRNK